MASMTEITEAEAKELLDAYHAFDKNGDGRISADEFVSVLRALGQNPTESMVKEILERTDANKSGFIEFDEYQNLIKSHIVPREVVEAQLIKAFKFFDKDNSGTLNVKELSRILTLCGEKMTKREVNEIFRELDKNKDGKLVYSEVSAVLCEKLMLN